MESITKTFEKFLKEQEDSLSKKTYQKYKNVIEIFENYLNGYAYQNLEDENYQKFEKMFNQKGKQYCESFTVQKLSTVEFNEFLSYYMIRKVMGTKSLMKDTGTVLRKFTTWLHKNEYLEDKQYEMLYSTINELKDDLPKLTVLSDLLYENGRRNSIYTYDEYKESNYVINRIEEGKIWLEDYMEPEEVVGPVYVTEEISKKAQENWSVYLVLGRVENNWYIIESGMVYPY
jgi:hypothetical protein